MKILFIGNSYTFFNDMPTIFEGLAKENGEEATVFSVTKGGRKLYQNLTEGDEWGEKIKSLCREHDFDVLILQEQSYLPVVDKEKFIEGAAGVKALVGAKRTVLYSTWGRKEGCPLLDELKISSDEMTEALATAYEECAKTLGAEISYVGRTFAKIRKTDETIELYSSDLSHPSYKGSVTAALCLYKTVFGKMPKSHTSLNTDNQVLTTIIDIIDHL
jgi:hypothetical protein